MTKLVDKLTTDIFNQCIQHFEKEENKSRMHEHVIDPIIKTII